jgi:hypothetical protein
LVLAYFVRFLEKNMAAAEGKLIGFSLEPLLAEGVKEWCNNVAAIPASNI